MVETEKLLSKETILHDIANALSPMANFRESMKDLKMTMEMGFEYLKKIQSEFESHGEEIGVYLYKNPRGRKILPALEALCRQDKKNLERLWKEVERIAERLDNANEKVATFQIRLAQENAYEKLVGNPK